MPTYEYRCDACGESFERFESITAEPDATCARCGKKRARRLIGAGSGLIFKGSGFYCSDYRSGSYKEAAKKDTAPCGAGPKSDACSSCPASKD
ncbi:MAG: zinc ribbon domain-containing protein [Planctomycetota bacterium]|nr:zinc ribbon domain-containing protein [Planctomycetota bacterium]